jgi:putative membrane protein
LPITPFISEAADSPQRHARDLAMIKNFSDHAANERTFLAWLRTGLAIAAFGFVIEKFTLFLATMAGSAAVPEAFAESRDRVLGPVGHYGGVVLMIIGVLIIAMSGVRFVRTTHEIDRPEMRSMSSVRIEIVLSGMLAALAAGLCIYLALR